MIVVTIQSVSSNEEDYLVIRTTKLIRQTVKKQNNQSFKIQNYL